MMRKTDLYRSIDSIRQDRELKSLILKAAEEKDKVIVVKRPLFVPIMVGVLLCLNIGMAAKLVIFNKSQVNMSELKARTSIETAEDMSSGIENNLAESDKSHEKLNENEEDSKPFLEYADEVWEEIHSGNYAVAENWSYSFAFDPSNELPCCFIDRTVEVDYDLSDEYYDRKEVGSGYRNYIRFVEQLTFKGDTYEYDGESTNVQMMTVVTNHEYIIGYTGEFSPENIISITESDVEREKPSEEYLQECSQKMKSKDVADAIEGVGGWMLDEDDPDEKYQTRYYSKLDDFYAYPSAASGEKGGMVAQCRTVLGSDTDGISRIYLIDSSGKDITSEMKSGKYWKETVFAHEDKAVIPDIIGMDIKEAERVLNEAGFKIGVRQYIFSDSIGFKFNQVRSIINHEPSEYVDKGSYVDVAICGVHLDNTPTRELNQDIAEEAEEIETD